jgi:hypothetical protein
VAGFSCLTLIKGKTRSLSELLYSGRLWPFFKYLKRIERFARDKCSGFFGLFVSGEENKFYNTDLQ